MPGHRCRAESGGMPNLPGFRVARPPGWSCPNRGPHRDPEGHDGRGHYPPDRQHECIL